MAFIDDFIEAATKCGSYAFDIEHEIGLEPYSEDFTLDGVGFGTEGLTKYVTDEVVYTELIRRLFKADLEAIAHNGKYDLKCLVGAGIITTNDYPNLVDTMVGMNLLNDNLKPNQLGLKPLVKSIYDHQMRDFKGAWGSEDFYAYAEDDARYTFKLWQDIRPKLFEQGLDKVFYKILMPTEFAFADMEITGFKWDVDGARRLLRAFQKIRDESQEDVYKAIGELNLSSGPQLADRLFHELNYSTAGVEMTPSGDRFSVNNTTMKKLADKYPVCEKILANRVANKMISTYVEPLTNRALSDKENRIHPDFWLVSSTGRTRCSNPNLQNCVARFDKYFARIAEEKGVGDISLRKGFVAREGCKLITADYSQVELRMIAHIAQDKMFLEAFKGWVCGTCGAEGEDTVILHQCPDCGAAEDEAALKGGKGFWHGLDLHQTTYENIREVGNRNNGKMCNFALVYGASAWRMHFEYPTISVDDWEVIIHKFMDTYRGVADWHSRLHKGLYEKGVVIDIFGRKRRILRDVIRDKPKNAFNMFINFAPQSSACALLELAMANMRKRFIEEGTWLNGVWPVNMVHDEVVFEVREDIIEDVKVKLEYDMEHAVQLAVPMRTEAVITDSWGDAK